MPRAEQPATPEACAELLRSCAERRETVRIRGGGTKDHLGTRGPTDVVLETASLGGIIDHVPEDLTVTVGAPPSRRTGSSCHSTRRTSIAARPSAGSSPRTATGSAATATAASATCCSACASRCPTGRSGGPAAAW